MWFKSILTLILDIATVISYPILYRFDNWYVYQMSFLCINFGNFFVNNYIVRSGMYVFVASVLNGEGGGGKRIEKVL